MLVVAEAGEDPVGRREEGRVERHRLPRSLAPLTDGPEQNRGAPPLRNPEHPPSQLFIHLDRP